MDIKGRHFDDVIKKKRQIERGTTVTKAKRD